MSGTFIKQIETGNGYQEDAELEIKIIDEHNYSLDPDSEWLEQLVQKTVVKVYKEIKHDMRDLKRKLDESERLRKVRAYLRSNKNEDVVLLYFRSVLPNVRINYVLRTNVTKIQIVSYHTFVFFSLLRLPVHHL